MSRHTYDLGLIGNCNYLALIGLDTNVKWMCLPRFDSSFVFGSLLDEEKGGEFSIKPEGEFDSKQYYVENTNVLVTEVRTQEGAYRVTDFAPRSSKVTPISSSKSRTCRLKAGCETCSFRAALETFSSRATAMK